jgi:hypothetical protein
MLSSFSSVERALAGYLDAYQPRTSSVSVMGGSGKPSNERLPFHHSFLDNLDERAELRRRLACLDGEDVLILVRWYVEGSRPETIARDLNRSVRHVYRRRVSGIERLVALGAVDEFADADLSEFV